jgi:hypothetical protein
VGTIAQRLSLALAATAELYQSATIEIESPAVLIKQLEITFDMDASVASHRHFCWHAESP